MTRKWKTNLDLVVGFLWIIFVGYMFHHLVGWYLGSMNEENQFMRGLLFPLIFIPPIVMINVGLILIGKLFKET